MRKTDRNRDRPSGARTQKPHPYVDQFIHGRAEGPIQMDVLKP